MQDVLGVFRGYGASPFKQHHPFKLHAMFAPSGDQPQAITELVNGLSKRNQVLLGVTGSGKTFTMANVIQNVQRPTLILAPNKTLAAQLYGEMCHFFPNNAVEYFVSYYDYYQPEAYIPRTQTYVEKEATINEQIERMRHSATRALLEREDVIVVASVSCIYGLGAIESYQGMAFPLMRGQTLELGVLFRQLAALQYKRNDIDFHRGTFRVRGDRVDLFPAHYENRAWSFSFFGNELESIFEIDVITGEKITALTSVVIYPNSHYVTPGPTVQQAIQGIRQELTQRVEELKAAEKLLEAQRLKERVTYDLETLAATGICAGIENYSRYLTGRGPGQPPPTLFEYLPANALLIVDESHVSVPQIRGMYLGDQARKGTLAEYGFRLPSCRDNRPLMFEEWDAMRPATIFVSATPGPWELEQTAGEVVEQLIRPTGLLDPECVVKPTEHQIDDLISEMTTAIRQGGRVLVTTLTKRMAEHLSEYLAEAGFRVRYMHSDIDTLERIQIIQGLRKGEFDILIGINLLREGLDIPECQLVAILDADKEGYLRSKTSLIQTMGRAARHPQGRVILYGDVMTRSLKAALEETHRRRLKQQAYNAQHGITPRAVSNAAVPLFNTTILPQGKAKKPVVELEVVSIEALRLEMLKAAETLDFERAAALRDQIKDLTDVP